MRDISNTLLERTKDEKEKGALDGKEEKSIIGVLSKFFWVDILGFAHPYLVKANDTESTELHLTQEEVLAQVSKFCHSVLVDLTLSWIDEDTNFRRLWDNFE